MYSYLTTVMQEGHHLRFPCPKQVLYECAGHVYNNTMVQFNTLCRECLKVGSSQWRVKHNDKMNFGNSMWLLTFNTNIRSQCIRTISWMLNYPTLFPSVGKIITIDNPKSGFSIYTTTGSGCEHPRDYIYMPWGYSPFISIAPFSQPPAWLLLLAAVVVVLMNGRWPGVRGLGTRLDLTYVYQWTSKCHQRRHIYIYIITSSDTL